MSGTVGQLAYRLAFQLSPIIFTGGIAGDIPGGILPIIALTQPLQFLGGLLSGGTDLNLDNAFANFAPMAGATILDLDIGLYPFANQAVAANATIAEPLVLSMLMTCPARDFAGYATKLATMLALREAVNRHAQKGGTYTVMTPSVFQTNGICTGLRDASSGESKQPQIAWQWDFKFPLLTLNQAQQAQNSLMAKLTSGTQLQGDPSWTSLPPTVGDPSSLASSSVLPVSANTAGAGIAGVNLPPIGGTAGDGYNIVSPFGSGRVG